LQYSSIPFCNKEVKYYFRKKKYLPIKELREIVTKTLIYSLFRKDKNETKSKIVEPDINYGIYSKTVPILTGKANSNYHSNRNNH